MTDRTEKQTAFRTLARRPWVRLAPVQAFLWGEFAFNVGRGYLLVAFTQYLFRTSGDLWHNLLYVASDVVFAFIVPFFAGSWIDRNGPGTLLHRSALGMSLLLFASAACAFSGMFSAQGMLVACLMTGVANASVRVCIFALTPLLAASGELMRINGRQQFAFQSGNLTGVLLAGALVDHVRLEVSFVLVAVFSAFAVFAYMNAASQVTNTALATYRDLRGGFLRLVGSLGRTPLLVAMFALGASDLVAISLFNLTLPVLIAAKNQGNSSAMAIVDSTFTFGSVVLGWVVGRYSIRGRQLHLLLVLMPVALIGVVLQTIRFNWIVCLSFSFATGFLVASYTVYFSATIQALVPGHLRGRFAALRRVVSTSVVSCASYVFTAAYSSYGLRGIAIATSAIGLVMMTGCIAWVQMRRQSNDVARHLAEDHEDLKPLFEPLVRLTSVNR